VSNYPFARRQFLKTGSIALGGSTILTQSVNAETTSAGEQIWSFETNSSVYSSPTVVDGTVYVGSNDGNVYALAASDGSEQWSFETGDYVTSSPTVVDGTVFVGSYDNNVYALDSGC